jgi:protein phosphatase
VFFKGVGMRIEFAYYTNKGHVRRNNQDALFLDGFGVFGDMKLPALGLIAGSNKAFFTVVDGAGGHACGEIASQTIVGEFIKRADTFSPDASTLSSDFIEIQNLMTEMSMKNSDLMKMAAALSGVLLRPGEITAFNVGDCRTYIMNRGFLKKLTHDHSIVQALRDNGMIGDDDMRTHPEKNRITSVLMADAEDAP